MATIPRLIAKVISDTTGAADELGASSRLVPWEEAALRAAETDPRRAERRAIGEARRRARAPKVTPEELAEERVEMDLEIIGDDLRCARDALRIRRGEIAVDQLDQVHPHAVRGAASFGELVLKISIRSFERAQRERVAERERIQRQRAAARQRAESGQQVHRPAATVRAPRRHHGSPQDGSAGAPSDSPSSSSGPTTATTGPDRGSGSGGGDEPPPPPRRRPLHTGYPQLVVTRAPRRPRFRLFAAAPITTRGGGR